MILTDLSVKRPVFALNDQLLLVAFGLVSLDKLPCVNTQTSILLWCLSTLLPRRQPPW